MAVQNELQPGVDVLLETLRHGQDYIHKVFYGVFHRIKNALVYIGVAIYTMDVLRCVFIRCGKRRSA